MKKLMILGASILQVPAIIKAKEMGLDVIVVDMNPKAVGFDIEGIKKEVISTIDIEGVLKAARKHNIDGIMTAASDMPMMTVATVCEKLRLIGISVDTALKATNKAIMRDTLREHDVPIPQYYKSNDIYSFTKNIQTIIERGNKCIVKPADNSGSRGVSLVNEFTNVQEVFKYTHRYSRSGEIVVEEYMEGPEVSVETFAEKGDVHVIQITDKTTTGSPYFVEMAHSQPSMLNDKIKEKIKEIAIKANKALGIDNGPSHTEIIVTKDGPKIVEIGARLGGDCITTHLVPISTGIDMVENTIRLAIGLPIDLTQLWNKGAAIKYLKSEKGIIKSIDGLDKARNIKNVVEISIVHGIGENAGEIMNSSDRIGFVVTKGDNVYEALSTADECCKLINISTMEI